jgi:hypothetical protein
MAKNQVRRFDSEKGGTMWRCISVLLAVAFLGGGAFAQEGSPASEAAPETKQTPLSTGIRGVWKITELASRAAGAEWEVREAGRQIRPTTRGGIKVAIKDI